MRYVAGLVANCGFLGIVAVIVCSLSAFPILVSAQGGPGQNAVYPASGTCCTGSKAFIDASMFAAQGVDFCGVLHNLLLNVVPATGAVIDARGLPFTNPPTSMTCSASPWAEITNPPPSTILSGN